MPPDKAFHKALENVSRDMAKSSTLPPVCYRDTSALDAERPAISHRSWLGIGRGDRWASAGDYAVLTLGGASVIVTRDQDNNLRAFANTCRHRGTALLAGEGNVPRIVCPFHGWTYALDGTLRGATRMGHASDFCHQDLGLIEFRAAEHAGFAYVCLSPDTPPLEIWLGNFDEHHRGWPLETLVTTRYRSFEVECNWKLFLEVSNESYHLDCVHADTFGGIYQEPDQPDPSTGCMHTQFSPTLGTGGLKKDEQDQSLPMMPGLTDRNREGTRYSWVFPSMTFAADSEALWAYDAQPITPERCRVTQWVCFPPETVSASDFETKVTRYYTRMDEALDEDIAVLESQQKGMSSPHARPGRWSEMENGAAAFAAWYAEQMRQADRRST